MNQKSSRRVPVFMAGAVIVLVCLARLARLDWSERLERMTFDMRAREALRFPAPMATNLGFVFIDEESVRQVASGVLGYRFGLQWPRQVYGRLVDELAEQGAQAVALDILFPELRPDHPPVQMATPTGPGSAAAFADATNWPGSDEFFAAEMRRAGNVILAATPDVIPPELFLTNASALGDVTTDKDKPEGILRRVKAFRTYRQWHPAFLQLAQDPAYGVDLAQAIVQSGAIILPRQARGLEDIRIPLDEDGNFEVADFWGDKLPPGAPRKAKPFKEKRVWQMGVVLAARALGLDLNRGFFDRAAGQIVLSGRGVQRVIPVDGDGYFYIDWSMPENHPALTLESIQSLLAQYRARLEGRTEAVVNRWRGKLVVVGSSAIVGSNLTDRGATPIRDDTILVSKHWNVANSILTDRFIRRAPLWLDLALIAGVGALSAWLTWNLRVVVASVMVALVLVVYVIAALWLYVQTRYWIPVVLPVFGALLITYVCLIAWRAIFEQTERRRVRSVFSTIVSPKIVNELLEAETLSLDGARREITVLFADAREFTALTEAAQDQAAQIALKEQLGGKAVEALFDELARETLATVNLYLGTVAEVVVQHDGTHDKFIGDCVMAFWGAPTPNPKHAVNCVRAAIEVQRAVFELNRKRGEENRAREAENKARLVAGLPPRPLLPILCFGTGINTGMATVGLMGSAEKGIVRQANYTVFGREVNLASRLESASGSGHIYIGQATYEHLLRDDPALAASCVPLSPQRLKGISGSVVAYEVPWNATPARGL